jgi:uncharacterized protein (DUF305 family)
MIKGMTQKMVEEQTKEIQELETFANAASGRKADSSFGKQIMQAMDKMHNQAMSATMSGNTDKDFVAMMIPHHQSAIEMAEIYLQHGRNAKLKSMASKNISDQKKEIDQMESWLKSH